jgi:Helix-turn-helix domain of resolvase
MSPRLTMTCFFRPYFGRSSQPTRPRESGSDVGGVRLSFVRLWCHPLRASTPSRVRSDSPSAEVARRRDELDQTFEKIAEEMGVTHETARKASLYHHWQHTEQTGDLERLKDLGWNRRMSLTKLKRIRELLEAGRSVNEIADEVGCSETVIYRESEVWIPSSCLAVHYLRRPPPPRRWPDEPPDDLDPEH